MMYWVSFIQKDSKDSEPRLCAAYNSCLDLEEAKRNIFKQRKLYDVLSAWIMDDNKNEIVFHKCYVDSCGFIEKPKGTGPYTVRYERLGRAYYSDEYTYQTEKEANEVIESEVATVLEELTPDEYDVEDFGGEVDITPVASTTVIHRWTRMWK